MDFRRCNEFLNMPVISFGTFLPIIFVSSSKLPNLIVGFRTDYITDGVGYCREKNTSN